MEDHQFADSVLEDHDFAGTYQAYEGIEIYEKPVYFNDDTGTFISYYPEVDDWVAAKNKYYLLFECECFTDLNSLNW